MWEEIQNALEVEIPLYLRNLLTITGYDNKLSLREMDNNDIMYVQEFARQSLADLVSVDDMEAYFGLYKNKPQNFTIMPGHRKLILAVSNYLKTSAGPARSTPMSKPSSVVTANYPKPSEAFPSYEIETLDLMPSSSCPAFRNPNERIVPKPSEVFHYGMASLEQMSSCPAFRDPSEGIVHDQGLVHAFQTNRVRNQEGNYSEEGAVLLMNLTKWLTANRPYMRENLSENDLDICVFPDNSHTGRSNNLLAAAVKCKKCRSSVKLTMTSPGRHWVTSNFHRHMRSAHFRLPYPQPPRRRILPGHRRIANSSVSGVGSVNRAICTSTCSLVSEVDQSAAGGVLDTPLLNSVLKVEHLDNDDSQDFSNPVAIGPYSSVL